MELLGRRRQALALGNADLKVEKVTGWEFGYKGSLSSKAYVTADVYINELKDFVTDLLPGVNPAVSDLRARRTASTCRPSSRAGRAAWQSPGCRPITRSARRSRSC